MHLAVDTLAHLLALHVSPADVGDRTAVKRLAADIQDATGASVRFAYVDQDYERYASKLAGFHVIAFVGHMLKHAAELVRNT